MRRRIGIALAALLLAACGGVTKVESGRPNVLFIAIDDMNDWAGCLGGHPQAKTPNIDRLASRGVLFTNAHCAAPLCTPSRTALFTGKYPEVTEVYSNSDRLDKNRPGLLTLPAHFRANGYRTYTTGKTFPVRGDYLTAAWDVRGPDQNAGGPQGGPFTREEYDRTGKPAHYLVERLGVTRPLSGMVDRREHSKGGSFDWGGFDLPDNAFGDGIVSDWAVEQLGSLGEEPFFFAVGFYRPHIPLYAPRQYFDRFPAAETRLPETKDGDLDDVPEAGKRFARVAATAGMHSWVIEADQWNEGVAAYLACINFVDTQVGRVLEALEQSGRAGNTIIVLWSDHGWHLGEKEHWGKLTGWEESTRVPMIIVLPSSMTGCEFGEQFRAGRKYGAATSLIDLYPTLVELAGLPAVPDLDGRSLVAELAGEGTAEEKVVVVNFSRGNHTVVKDNWRYIRYFDGTEELYDMAADPNQYTNLAAKEEQQERIKALRAHIPEASEIAWTARWRQYKMVEFREPGRPPLLFDLKRFDSVMDRYDIAAENPEIVERIRSYAKRNGLTSGQFVVPDGG